ncbi:MAG: hypothetical protein CMM37_00195 [Rhodospirillaceae bacterium]|nr:hypothetical protein [Rhodospirillaceae bacterium]
MALVGPPPVVEAQRPRVERAEHGGVKGELADDVLVGERLPAAVGVIRVEEGGAQRVVRRQRRSQLHDARIQVAQTATRDERVDVRQRDRRKGGGVGHERLRVSQEEHVRVKVHNLLVLCEPPDLHLAQRKDVPRDRNAAALHAVWCGPRGPLDATGVVGDGLQLHDADCPARVQLAKRARAACVCEDCERFACVRRDEKRSDGRRAHPHDSGVCRVVLHAHCHPRAHRALRLLVLALDELLVDVRRIRASAPEQARKRAALWRAPFAQTSARCAERLHRARLAWVLRLDVVEQRHALAAAQVDAAVRPVGDAMLGDEPSDPRRLGAPVVVSVAEHVIVALQTAKAVERDRCARVQRQPDGQPAGAEYVRSKPHAAVGVDGIEQL